MTHLLRVYLEHWFANHTTGVVTGLVTGALGLFATGGVVIAQGILDPTADALVKVGGGAAAVGFGVIGFRIMLNLVKAVQEENTRIRENAHEDAERARERVIDLEAQVDKLRRELAEAEAALQVSEIQRLAIEERSAETHRHHRKELDDG